MRIMLYGHLRKFGKEFNLDVKTPAEGIRALCTMKPAFREHFEKHSDPGYRVRIGASQKGAESEALNLPCSDVVRIVPVVAGAKDGWGQILTGIALIALVYFTGGMAGAGLSMTGTSALSSMTIALGTSMVIGGVAQLIAGNPNFSQSALDKGPADTPSYAFSGPHMTTGQGNPVPLGYGKMRVSGALVSLSISSETWRVGGFKDGGAEDGTRSGDGDITPWVWAVAPS